MAKFFKYKTLDMLREDIEQLGVGVRIEDELRACLEPLEIGGRKVGNRFAIHPMEGCDGELDGKPGELTIRRWERFGAGGAKLIWGEATAVADEVRANTRQLLINDGNLASLADMLERTRKAHRDSVGDDSDLLIGLQLTHSGRYSYKGPLIAQHDPAVDAVTIADKKKRLFVTDEYPILTDDELRIAGDLIVEGARLSAKAGFDFVDIKQCHRYLLSELLAASGQEHPEEMTRDDIYHRVGSSKILRFDELYPPLEVGCIVNGNTPPEYQRYVDAASAETFATNFRNGRPRDASGGTFTIE